jgi:hypothetical protein
MKQLAWLSVAVFLVSWQTGTARGQYPYNPYFPFYYGNARALGPGYLLQGTASVIDATGNLYKQQEQARILREQANQAKLDTKRKTLDELNYERENTWTFTQEQERHEAIKLRRLLNKPLETEIVNGSAMNTLLPYLNQIANSGVQGPPVYVDQSQLKLINISGASDGSSLGVLKDGKVSWPLALRGPTQKKMDVLLPKAMAAARDGTLDLATYRELTTGADQMQKEAMNAWNKEEIDSGLYLDAKRFLESYRSGLTVLKRPDAAKYLGGGYELRGNTVGEVVQNMSQQGLHFAPATAGTESAYFGLYNGMVAFAAGDTNSSSFRVRLGPAGPGPTAKQ